VETRKLLILLICYIALCWSRDEDIYGQNQKKYRFPRASPWSLLLQLLTELT